MIIRDLTRCIRRSRWVSTGHSQLRSALPSSISRCPPAFRLPPAPPTRLPSILLLHTSRYLQYAQTLTADAVMENLNDLYATAKDEFEIAAEETGKKTVYAADDREAAQEAFKALKEAFEQAVKESDPETGKEVQGRVGQSIRELGNAITAMEESALED